MIKLGSFASGIEELADQDGDFTVIIDRIDQPPRDQAKVHPDRTPVEHD